MADYIDDQDTINELLDAVEVGDDHNLTTWEIERLYEWDGEELTAAQHEKVVEIYNRELG